jgi:3-dehydroquinate dehydratase / shikimate dehydrogenase
MLIACPDCIPKLVFEAAHIIDCFDVFDVIAERDSNVIAFAMGESGLISRVLAKKYGSLVSYASIDDASATAPGQITIEQLKNLYHWDSIDEKTQVFGVVANPVGHSLSPAIHNACFADAGVNSVYLPMLVKGDWIQFKLFMDGIVKRPYLDFRGMSVTIPHKQNALQWMTENGEYIETVAGKIGAVNTLAVGFNERITGYNTDYSGVLDALTCEMGISRTEFLGRKAAVVGAGGVGRAVIAGLTEYGAKVTIYNRTEAKARKLAIEFGAMHKPLEQLPDMDAEIVINCTSVGMEPNVDESPISSECLKEGMIVFDTVYNPPETLLLRYAGQAKARTISGVEMFVRQAMEQFKYFTGKEANAELMRETIRREIKSRD